MTTMNTGDVERRIGVPITANLLTALGFEAVGRDKRAMLWDQKDYPKMCEALAKYIKGRADVPMQPKPEKVAKKAAPTKGTPAADDDEEL